MIAAKKPIYWKGNIEKYHKDGSDVEYGKLIL